MQEERDGVTTIRDLELQLDQLRTSVDGIVGTLTKAGMTAESLAAGLHAAIVLKEHQRYGEAERVFLHLRSRWAGEERFRYEYIQFLRRVDRPAEADAVLMAALDGPIMGDLLRECIVRGLLEHPETPLRVALLEALTCAASHGVSAYHQGILNFFASRAVRRSLEREPRPVLDLDESFRLCLSAIRGRRPFCLLRLGDGEGAFLNSLSCPPSQQAMFHDHREHFTMRWYGDRALAADAAFLRAAAEIEAGLDEADIIGVPQPAWLAHEIKMRSLRSIVNCLQLVTLAASPRFDTPSRFASTTIAVDFDYRGMLTQLLAESPVTLITSHAGLGARLEAAGRAEVRQVIGIPPARSDLAKTGYDPAASHFRHAFERVNAAIDALSPGEVVLVGAGFLGKSYCLRIKRRGGIALDLGSLMELWMGYLTRPSFVNLGHLRLGD
jgi:hypothetical protein